MKKIAIICETVGIAHRGGESFAIELGNYLTIKYEVDLYTRGEKVDGFNGNVITVDYAEDSSLKQYRNLYDNNKLIQKFVICSRYTSILNPNVIHGYKWGKKVFERINENDKYDVIYPITGPGCHWLARKYKKKTNIPFFAKGGGGIGPGEWWALKCKPDMYVCISTEQYEWASKYYDRITMIPNGTYVNHYNIIDNTDKYEINHGHKLVISVGHLDTSFKRHQLTIQAVSKLANVDLLILGYGESKEQFEMMGEQLMPGRLKIMGVPHNDVVHYYKSADCFALPSLGEPFGIVYIEAMASGLPCIGTDDKTRREIIGEAGFVCNVEDAYEYADTINKALNIDWNGKPLRRAELYDYSIIGEKYCEMIEKMLDDKI